MAVCAHVVEWITCRKWFARPNEIDSRVIWEAFPGTPTLWSGMGRTLAVRLSATNVVSIVVLPVFGF
jgi:hypothetical protein